MVVNTSESVRKRLAENVVQTAGGCLLWQGPLTRDGYGQEVHYQGRRYRAHRLAYLLTYGELDPSLGLDHLCHTRDSSCPGGIVCLHRRCVNPQHLEQVTNAENMRRLSERMASCKKGHERTPENLSFTRKGQARCRTCDREAQHRCRRARGVQPRNFRRRTTDPQPRRVRTSRQEKAL